MKVAHEAGALKQERTVFWLRFTTDAVFGANEVAQAVECAVVAHGLADTMQRNHAVLYWTSRVRLI